MNREVRKARFGSIFFRSRSLLTQFRLFGFGALFFLRVWGPWPVISFAGEPQSLTARPWVESRTLHFHTYSCGPSREVAKLAARLEQFQEAYSVLAGAQAVASPPIVVIAFPDHEAMTPFLPLYNDQPANLAAFFIRGSDENLIVLSLSQESSEGLEAVFHEYTHLLLRHNARFWPLWLNEGMAEIYSTFEVTGEHTVRIGKPIEHHLHLLAHSSLMPLKDLFAVAHDSPEYNERERQGVFYAESWLLTHYLMAGPIPAHKSGFSRLTQLLRQGQTPEQAFTNGFLTPLPAMEKQLRLYLEAGKFSPVNLAVQADLYAARSMANRSLTPVEVLFRLGDEQFRIGRFKSAHSYFERAQRLAPKSPLPYEGLGLLAAERDEHEAAIDHLYHSLQLGSTSYLAHYIYAAEKYQLTAHETDRYTHVDNPLADEIRTELQKSLKLMPDFGPAHHLLGFFEMVQREDLAAAEQHLQRAVQLEPEKYSYLFSLAQVQVARRDPTAARRTLELLRFPYVEPELRADAAKLLREVEGER
jgi:Flp pilus assembly protein TadD